jgi:hypothetical protein
MIQTEMSCQYEDFIGTYKNVFPDGFCRHVIDCFEDINQNSKWVKSRKQEKKGTEKFIKDDKHVYLNDTNISQMLLPNWRGQDVQDMLWKGLQIAFDQYESEYDILCHEKLCAQQLKMQRTSPGEGYHVWHYEDGGGGGGDRCLVYSIYLNDIDDAGETEFLYLKKRVKPEENKIIIWPSGFTHTHRGNVVHGNQSKYIITGWFYYI